MLETLEVTIEKQVKGSATVFILDTEHEVKSCFLTKKYEAKITTMSGRTQITEPLMPPGNYVGIVKKHTTFAYIVVFLASDKREDIIL